MPRGGAATTLTAAGQPAGAAIPLNIGCMLIDECHYLKEHQAGRTRNAFLLADRIPRVFLLTGTPVLNRVMRVMLARALSAAIAEDRYVAAR